MCGAANEHKKQTETRKGFEVGGKIQQHPASEGSFLVAPKLVER